MRNFIVDQNILFVGNNKMEFQSQIDNVKKCANLYIVLVDEIGINNVYAVNEQAQIVWQIEDAGSVYSIINDVPYVGTRITESNQIVVTNFNGVTYTVNPTNGKIISRGTAK